MKIEGSPVEILTLLLSLGAQVPEEPVVVKITNTTQEDDKQPTAQDMADRYSS